MIRVSGGGRPTKITTPTGGGCRVAGVRAGAEALDGSRK